MDIAERIRAYLGDLTLGEHDRYRSWEHCFQFFRHSRSAGIADQRRNAALQLGFYLASWGMYRGSGFLLQRAYTVHLGVIDCLAEPRFSLLWEKEFGDSEHDVTLIPTVLEAIKAVRSAYKPFGDATDTLVTKVVLGTLGCLPACDRYFLDGFKSRGFKYSYPNRRFVEQVLQFCRTNLSELRQEQQRIEDIGGVHYTLMKLVDMYFWEVGYELNSNSPQLASEAR